MNTDPRTVDAEYRFGKPKVYLTPIEIARLTIVRSRLGDTRAERAAEMIATATARTSAPTGGAQSN